MSALKFEFSICMRLILIAEEKPQPNFMKKKNFLLIIIILVAVLLITVVMWIYAKRIEHMESKMKTPTACKIIDRAIIA